MKLFFVIGLMIASTPSFAMQANASQGTAPQVAPSPIHFDIVSVTRDKDDDPAKPGLVAPRDGDSITYRNLPLFYVVLFSNNFHRFNRVIGMPAWAKAEKYDITAKVAPGDVAVYHMLTSEQKLAMFQQVLADRFKLRFHREPREMPVFDLVVSKDGVKMKEAPQGEVYSSDLKSKYGQSILLTSTGRLEAQGGVMADLALILSDLNVGREVVDRTGLVGKYDFTLEWAQDGGATSEGPGPSDARGSLFTAVQEQLGLKLEPAKNTVECFVVDHVERPAEN